MRLRCSMQEAHLIRGYNQVLCVGAKATVLHKSTHQIVPACKLGYDPLRIPQLLPL
jgi:hypothetical protein